MIIVGIIDEELINEINLIAKLTVVTNRIHQLTGVDE